MQREPSDGQDRTQNEDDEAKDLWRNERGTSQ
jgi:hypothetical protein